ncbi:MAG: hypothetical protein IKM37_05615, partial [Alistipes sp.]|nr:hypothetical protein [Alistipes sp.]
FHLGKMLCKELGQRLDERHGRMYGNDTNHSLSVFRLIGQVIVAQKYNKSLKKHPFCRKKEERN